MNCVHTAPGTSAGPSAPAGTVAGRLADWASHLTYEAIPAEAVESAKLLLLDQIGLQASGAALGNVQPQLQMVAAMRAAPQSTVVGTRLRTTAGYAAFANGTTAGSSEFDDVHMYGAHLGSHVVPPALAFAEAEQAAGRPVSGRDLLTAVVAGAQVMSLLGAPSMAAMVGHGWHGSKILGTLGAASATAKILKLPVGRHAHALAIAGSDAGGSMEYEFSGGEVKRMHSGSAARLGGQAAWLARAGLTGPLTIVEGRRGLFRLFAAQPLVIDDALWEHFHIVDTAFRTYPAIGSAATVLEGLTALTREHPPLDWRDIARIRVGLPPIAVSHGAATTHPSDAVSAQFSTAFGIALILVHGSATTADYTNPALWADPDISTVIDKVEPRPCDFGASAPLLSAHLEIQLNDGTMLTRLQHGFRGHPGIPGLRDAVQEKFRANLRGLSVAPAAEAIAATVNSLEDEPDLTRLISLLVPPEPDDPPVPAASREEH